jgi:hypothetical protein
MVPTGRDPVSVQNKLKQRGLICAVRGPYIRLSPHFYQAGQPMAEMMDVLDHTLS